MKKNLVVMLAVLFVGTSVFGQQKRKGKKPSVDQVFERLDSNQNGLIDLDEASNAKRGKLSENFSSIDTNADGGISKDEMKTFAENRKSNGNKRSEKRNALKEMDTNGDNELSKTEVENSGKEKLIDNFDAIDADGSGSINGKEIKTYFKQQRS